MSKLVLCLSTRLFGLRVDLLQTQMSFQRTDERCGNQSAVIAYFVVTTN